MLCFSRNDDKRLQTFDKITTYPYETNAFKVCESEMLSKIWMINFDDYEIKVKQNIIKSDRIFQIFHTEY